MNEPISCAFRGARLRGSIRVACLAVEGYLAYDSQFECLNADIPQRKCLPSWEGPWQLPDRAVEAALFAVCRQCPGRSE